MEPRQHQLSSGHVLLIREAEVGDARALLDYLEAVSGESDFLSFGPSEFELTETEEEDTLRGYRDSDNSLYVVGLVDGTIVSTLTFSAGRRPRIRHSGEFATSVRRQFWGLGIGSLMLDTLLAWARDTRIVKKINLHVRTDNQRAIALYKRKGFVVEGMIRKAVFLDGTYHDVHWMGLET